MKPFCKHYPFFFVLFFWLCFGLGHVYSQQRELLFVSELQEPVPFVSVQIQELKQQFLADSSGRVLIGGLKAGNYTLKAQQVGYEPFKTSFQVFDSQKTYVFILTSLLQDIEEVVVSGTLKEVSKLESPVPVEIYTSQFFKANPTPSVFESLQNINGVRPQLNCNVCNTGDIHINGLEGPYTMVLLDGMPIVSGLSTVYGLTGIPQALIERVEIVKGPASTLYGSEAVGGLINIITKKPTHAPVLSFDAFSSNWADFNADLGIKFKLSKQVHSLLGINYFNYQNPLDNNRDGFTDVTLQHRVSVFNKINVQRAEDRLFNVAVRYNYEDRWGGDMRWNNSFRGGDSIYGESIMTKRWEMVGTYQLPMREHVVFQWSANSHHQNSVYGNMPYIATQNIAFGQLLWSKTLRRQQLIAGVAYRYVWYDDNTPATSLTDSLSTPLNNPSVTNLPGVFVQNEIHLTPISKLLVGLRADYNDKHGYIFSPRMNYKLSSTNKKNILRLSLGNGYRVANVFTEDHAALTGARTVVFEGELRPETSWNGNLNFVKKIYNKHGSSINIDATAFYTHFKNRIVPDYLTDPNKIIYANLEGFATSQGVSINLDAAFDNGLSVAAGATLMDVNLVENGIKQRQLLTERFSAVWSLGYEWHQIGLSIDYTGNLYGPMLLPLLGELDNRPAKSPFWSLQNIQVTKKLGYCFEVYGGIKNLLNYTPPANSIARAFDPFDRDVQFDSNGQVLATPSNPNALTFDPTYVFAPNQGIRGFLGLRYTLR
ncbi:MAG: TonB-dependent receptor [Cytophagales bacterium]|nr:MAG: TonB-dependent receptor [Cytophagales bacterium]TAF60363.1 MAG: TonB-dependent receptor [Cytophagales bacterium]